jgi:Epoxide hydrolase N terminus
MPAETPGTRAEPFWAQLDSAALADLARRLDAARLPAQHDSTWERGVPGSWLAALIADWRAFDPQWLQARLDRLTHLRAEVDGIAVHLVYAPGSGPDPLPLLLTHGWPSSFLEYLDLLPLLTDPGGHGGQPADAFTVVAPSLPGFGFSGSPPTAGLTHEQVAELWYQIMTGILGYPVSPRTAVIWAPG